MNVTFKQYHKELTIYDIESYITKSCNLIDIKKLVRYAVECDITNIDYIWNNQNMRQPKEAKRWAAFWEGIFGEVGLCNI